MNTSKRFNILILDSRHGAYLTDPDIEREILEPYGAVELQCVDHALEAIDRLEQADVIISWHHIAVTSEVLSCLRRCRGIVRASVGYDNIDLACAARLGIPVCNVPDYGTEEVADHTMALILALVRKLHIAHHHCQQGGWEWRTVGNIMRIRGASLGIVGFGRIGSAVARRAQVFGLKVSFYDPYLPSGTDKSHAVHRYESLAELLSHSQILSLHVPLTSETRGMIGKAELGRLKFGAILVNTSRGEVMSQRALIEALGSGQISQAGLDVLEGEPEVPHELKSSSQVLMTAHSAFYSDLSLKELRRKAALAAVRLLRGEAEPNIINNVPSIANFKDCQLLVGAAE